MEEAEALSTKMGIMVRGGIFKCFGSSQHIKSKYCTGYEIEVKISRPDGSELENLAQSLRYTVNLDQRCMLSEVETHCFGQVDDIIWGQLTKDGLGSELAMEAAVNEGSVRLRNLVNFFHVMKNGLQFISIMTREFPTVELIEQCSDFFKFRVPRNNKTIGWLFNVLQESKHQCNISEFSVSQTSLEQIFATFANMTIENSICLIFNSDEKGKLNMEQTDRMHADFTQAAVRKANS